MLQNPHMSTGRITDSLTEVDLRVQSKRSGSVTGTVRETKECLPTTYLPTYYLPTKVSTGSGRDLRKER
jgi:hypothetical protein